MQSSIIVALLGLLLLPFSWLVLGRLRHFLTANLLGTLHRAHPAPDTCEDPYGGEWHPPCKVPQRLPIPVVGGP